MKVKFSLEMVFKLFRIASIDSRKVKGILGLVATLNSIGLSSADGNHDDNVDCVTCVKSMAYKLCLVVLVLFLGDGGRSFSPV